MWILIWFYQCLSFFLVFVSLAFFVNNFCTIFNTKPNHRIVLDEIDFNKLTSVNESQFHIDYIIDKQAFRALPNQINFGHVISSHQSARVLGDCVSFFAISCKKKGK